MLCRLHEFELAVERDQKCSREPGLKTMIELNKKMENGIVEELI